MSWSFSLDAVPLAEVDDALDAGLEAKAADIEAGNAGGLEQANALAEVAKGLIAEHLVGEDGQAKRPDYGHVRIIMGGHAYSGEQPSAGPSLNLSISAVP